MTSSFAERRGGALPYQRQEGEYARPESALQIVTWEQAREVELRSEEKISSLPCFWAGVRGTQFADGSLWFHAPDVAHELWAELVPEPFNPHDANAVAVDIDGVRVGYMKAKHAEYAHRHVSALVANGQRVLVPILFSTTPNVLNDDLTVDAFAAFPTFRTFERHLPAPAEYRKIFLPLWRKLEESVREEISANGFRLTEDTLAELARLRHFAPRSGLRANIRLNAVPRPLELFLQTERARQADERHRLERARMRAQAFRCKDLHEQGITNVEIARRESISPATVAKRLQAAGVKKRKPATALQLQQVRSLHREGMSPAVIAKKTGLGIAQVRRAIG